MSITLGDAVLHLRSDDSQLQSGLQGAGSGISKWLTGLQAAIPAVIGAAIVAGFKKGVDAAAEQETALTSLSAVYRATGGSIGMTIGELAALASHLSKVTGLEDEQVMQAEALAMTYGILGRDDVPRVMTVAADMATLFGGDLSGATRTLMQCLAGGEEGMTRLRRAGIVLTEAELAQAKAFYEAGDAAGAYDVILGAIEGRVGGAAAAQLDTYAGSVRAMGVAWGEVWEAVGGVEIQGKPLIQWMTEAIQGATQLVEGERGATAEFQYGREERQRGVRSYEGYARAELDAAVAAGLLTQGQADLFLAVRENADQMSGFGYTAYVRTITAMRDLGILTNAMAWASRDAAGGWDEGTRAVGRFGSAVNAVPSTHTTTLNVEDTQALQELDAFMARLAAAGLWTYSGIGGFGLGAGGQQIIGGGGVPTGGAPGTVSAAMAWRAQAGVSPMSEAELLAAGYTPGQGGLGFDVEGPSGSDQVPVNLALSRGEHVEVTPAGERERRAPANITFNVSVRDRDDLQALENQIAQIFRGI